MKKDNLILLFIGISSLIYFFEYSNNQNLFLYLSLFVVIIVILAKLISIVSKRRRFTNVQLSLIDIMAGNEFEEYLAFLLEKLSYENVKVTSMYLDRLLM